MLKKFPALWEVVSFFFRNLIIFSQKEKIQERSYAEFIVTRLPRSELKSFLELYRSLNEGKQLPFKYRLLAYAVPSKVVFVAKKGRASTMFGYMMISVGARDRPLGAVCAPYLGVQEGMQGFGVSTALHESVMKHAVSAGFGGVSGDLRTDNTKAFKAAKTSGFEVVGEYIGADGSSYFHLFNTLDKYRK